MILDILPSAKNTDKISPAATDEIVSKIVSFAPLSSDGSQFTKFAQNSAKPLPVVSITCPATPRIDVLFLKEKYTKELSGKLRFPSVTVSNLFVGAMFCVAPTFFVL